MKMTLRSLIVWIIGLTICVGWLSGCNGPDEASFGVIKKIEKVSDKGIISDTEWKIITSKGTVTFKDNKFGYEITKHRVLGKTVMRKSDGESFYIRGFNDDKKYTGATFDFNEKGIR